MSRYATMTTGFLLLFIGAKLLMVESYLLTPKATKFWVERIQDPETLAPAPNQVNYANPYQQASYQNNYNNQYNPYSNNSYGTSQYSPYQSSAYQTPSYQPNYPNANLAGGLISNTQGWPQKQLTPPRWIGWPFLFLGAVLFLHGLSLRRE